MKILFAVSNENVSKKIVESYQKKYGETVSYKNVFYFNAIIREIHKDKTYDRIVISEDLEPFSNNNYDVIDKFILERFKEISNELSSQDRFVDITVICTDRRTKAGYVLSKMYDYGIYNALIGKDRRIDNVCTLLNNPRTAQEAETYYELKNQVDTSSVDDVSEQEVQNILIHYKRLGRNEERYVDSFNNIASQYTDKQLKIIIKCLPINVRAVLEAECPKYQELVTYADESEEERKKKIKLQEQKRIEQLEQEKRLKQKLEKEKREDARNAQRINQEQERMQRQQQTTSGIDLLDNKRKEQRMTGNVIIPGNMDIRNERKVYTDEEINNLQQRSARPVQERQTADTLPGLDEFDSIPQQRATQQPASTLPGLDEFDSIPQPKPVQQQASTLPGLDEFDNIPQQRATQQPASTLPGLDEFDSIPQQRPTQQPASTLPGLDEFDNMQQQRPTQQPASTLPGLDEFDSIPQQRATQQPANTLPGLDEFDSIPQQRPTQQQAHTLPGLDEIDSISGVKQTQQPLKQKSENSTQMQMEAVASQPEISQQPKRGRGRPRKNPIEPPKPKGKRGRPRKNPLPEESENKNEKEKILPGINDFENIPQLDNIQRTETSVTQNMPVKAEKNLPKVTENKTELPKTVENQQNIQQPASTLPGTNDWDKDPFEPVNTQQSASTLPGTNDWDKDPFEPVNTQQSASTLPGTNDWDKDPFEPVNTQPKPNTTSSSNNWNDDPFELNPKSQETLSSTQMNPQLNNSQQYQEIPNNKKEEKVAPYAPNPEKAETLQKIEENRIYTTGSLNSILTKDKKIVAFVGASKSGTSFLINNLGCLFSSIGIKTAILDMTKNKNSYYIYTNNDEKLRNIAYTSIENLEKGIAEGINIDRNLSVYTTVPNDGKDYSNGETILSTLIQNESLVLIDCDFETDPSYFANAQEIYLIQSMDILTIQPLTAFLRELKTMGILDPEKLRIVINKEIKVKNLTSKAIIGGMSFYNDPAMSYMTELFNKEKIRACTIPFDENVYSKYLEEVVNCVITINGYSKNFMNNLKLLGNMVYPLLSKQTYSSKNTVESNYGNNFSTEMNNTLNQMKNKY